MHAAQRAAACIERRAALDEVADQPVRCELIAAVGSHEPATCIVVAFRRNNERTGELKFVEPHQMTWRFGIGTTNLPPQSRTSRIWSMISSFRFHGRMNT